MGTILLGKLETGTISKNQTLTMMPNKVCIDILLQSYLVCLDVTTLTTETTMHILNTVIRRILLLYLEIELRREAFNKYFVK